MRTDADLIVLGAGCAGLALASRLSRYGDLAPRTVILDQRKDYSNDRTWCFWGDEATPFARDAGHQWRRLRISAAGNVVDFDCAETPYRMLGSELEALTRERDLILQGGTYGARNTASMRLPGALVRDFTLVL